MNQHGNGCFPSYGTISEYASLGRSTVIKHVNEATRLGWLRRKRRPRGNLDNDSNSYEIAFPAADPGIPGGLGVVHLVDQGGIPGGPALVHQVDPTTPVLTPHRTKKALPRSTRVDWSKDEEKKRLKAEDLIADGIDPDLAKDFLAHRKTKKAPLTERAYAGIKREADKAGWKLPDALTKAIERNWVGFEAEWVAKPQQVQKNASTGFVASQEGDWWESKSEIERRGADAGLKQKQGEDFIWFKCRVAKAMKERRWMDLILADLLRTKNQHYAAVYQYFNGTPPMECV